MKSKIHNPSFCEQAKQHQKNNLKILSLFLGIAILSSCSKSDDVPTTQVQVKPRSESFQESGLTVNITDATLVNSVSVKKETEVSFTFNESDNPKVIDYKKIRLDLNIAHTKAKDLEIALIAPNTAASFFVYRVTDNAEYVASNKLRFSGQFTNLMPSGGFTVPAGDFRESKGDNFPSIALLPIFSTFQGIDVNGIWKLRITDHTNGNIGTLERVRLTFESGSIK
jgi:subtilisin-like proprotein convertase family protein